MSPDTRVTFHGNVFTSADTPATSVVIEAGRILEVGGHELAERERSAGGNVVEVREGLLCPGFVDAHTHLGHMASGSLGAVDCRVPRVRNIDELVELLRREDARLPEGQPLVGYGNLFYDRKLADGRLPDRDDLDRASRTRPIIVRAGGHISALNSAALELVADLSEQTPGHFGHVRIDRDADGRATGFVSEVDALLPRPPRDAAMLRAALRETAYSEYIAFGVTTLCEMAEDIEMLYELRDLCDGGHIPARIVAFLMAPAAMALDDAFELLNDDRGSSSRLRLGGIKVFADGGYSSRGAAIKGHYRKDHFTPAGWSGQLNVTPEALSEIWAKASRADVDVAVHVNGERAQEVVVDSWLGSPRTAKLRLEHAGNFMSSPSGMEKWRDARIPVVLNPGFFNSYIGDFFPDVLEDMGWDRRMPVRTLLDSGASVAMGSDSGLGAEPRQSDPMTNIWALVTRRGYSGSVVQAEEAITPEEALRLFTIESAKALHLDSEVGTIEPGKVADLVILDSDPRAVHPDNIRDIRPTAVFIDGSLVYGSIA